MTKPKKPQVNHRRSSATLFLHDRTCTEFHEIMAEHGVVLIHGTPASGKTTLMKKFHIYLYNSHPELMVCSLRNWSECGGSGLGVAN
jgi:HrpA-like RNA helicase